MKAGSAHPAAVCGAAARAGADAGGTGALRCPSSGTVYGAQWWSCGAQVLLLSVQNSGPGPQHLKKQFILAHIAPAGKKKQFSPTPGTANAPLALPFTLISLFSVYMPVPTPGAPPAPQPPISLKPRRPSPPSTSHRTFSHPSRYPRYYPHHQPCPPAHHSAPYPAIRLPFLLYFIGDIPSVPLPAIYPHL